MDEASKAVLRVLAVPWTTEEHRVMDAFIRTHAKHYEFPAECEEILEALFQGRFSVK